MWDLSCAVGSAVAACHLKVDVILKTFIIGTVTVYRILFCRPLRNSVKTEVGTHSKQTNGLKPLFGLVDVVGMDFKHQLNPPHMKPENDTKKILLTCFSSFTMVLLL